MNKRIETIIIVGLICSGVILGIDNYFKEDNNIKNENITQVINTIGSILK